MPHGATYGARYHPGKAKHAKAGKKSKKRKTMSRNRDPQTGRIPRFFAAVAPDVTYRKLTYVSRVVVEPAASALNPTTVNDHQFRANSLYDPDYTVVASLNPLSTQNHQPLGFDELMQIYSKYQVLGSKITCTFCPNHYDIQTGGTDEDGKAGTAANELTAQQPALLVGIARRDTSEGSMGSKPTLVIENKEGVHAVVTHGQTKKMTYTFDATRDFPVRSTDWSEQAGLVNSSPALGMWFNVWCACVNPNSINANGVAVLVSIEYNAKFFDKVQLEAS